MTDLWVEGRRCCSRAADILHKEGPILKSKEEAAAVAATAAVAVAAVVAAAATAAKEQRNKMWASGEP